MRIFRRRHEIKPIQETMAESTLNRLGLYFDQENKIRILEPNSSELTIKLMQECSEFKNNTFEFISIVNDYIKVVDELKERVEKEKIKALGSRNALKSLAKQRASNRHQIMVLMNEKKQELERLIVFEQSLAGQELEQKDLIERLTNQR